MKKTLITILVLTLIGIVSVDSSKWRRTFNSEQWINPASGEENWQLRWEMIGSLKWNHRLKGMSTTEITNLLGEPTSYDNSSWGYDLGPSGRGINYGTLELRFENDLCASYRVYQH